MVAVASGELAAAREDFDDFSINFDMNLIQTEKKASREDFK